MSQQDFTILTYTLIHIAYIWLMSALVLQTGSISKISVVRQGTQFETS